MAVLVLITYLPTYFITSYKRFSISSHKVGFFFYFFFFFFFFCQFCDGHIGWAYAQLKGANGFFFFCQFCDGHIGWAYAQLKGANGGGFGSNLSICPPLTRLGGHGGKVFRRQLTA
jgi:hypothetical protein